MNTATRPHTDVEARDRDRVLVPAAMTLGLLAVIGIGVVGMGLLFLYVDRDLALMLAIVAAGGVLASVAIASSRDSLDGGQKVVAMLPAVVPVLVAAGFAMTGVEDADRNINRQPLSVFPVENAVEILAVNQEQFETGDVVLPASTDEELQVGILFDNEHAGVVHNVWIGTEVAPAGAETNVFEGANVTGVATAEYSFVAPPPTEGLIYWCSIHPNMVGGVSFVADAEPDPPVEG